MNDYAVILTHNRPVLLERCVAAIGPQVGLVIIVDNASEPAVDDRGWPANVSVRHVAEQPPNLGKLWNAQLDELATWNVGQPWNVALLCDDVVVPDDWYARVRDGLRHHGAVAASTHSYAPISTAYVLHELTNGVDRLCPWAFMLAGERGLRADESMAWFYVDTDLDWRARQAGGSVIVPGAIAPNLEVGYWTAAKPELTAQAVRDGETFWTKWHRR